MSESKNVEQKGMEETELHEWTPESQMTESQN